MNLTIDNDDGLGARDYTGMLDAERPARVRRLLNRPAELRAWLYAPDADFVVPVAGARVLLARNDGTNVFTGYVCGAPAYEYLGWGERGPAYRYALRAVSDESRLAQQALAARPDFVHRAGGEILAAFAGEVAPGMFDVSQCAAVGMLPAYAADPRNTFAEHAAELALRARASYRVQDGKLFFRPIGETTYALDETSADLSPEDLVLQADDTPLNDVTVVGAVEPDAYVKDFFLADGYTLSFNLSERPYIRPGTVLVDEEYRGTMLRPAYWKTNDGAAVTVSGGKLLIAGAAQVRFEELIELGGGLSLDHGEFQFTAASGELIGGLYDGGWSQAACIAGFRVVPSGQQFQIATVALGNLAGATMATRPGCRYALSTRIYASSVYREAQTYCTETGARGGAAVASSTRVVLQAREIDPNDSASLAAPATVLLDAWLLDVPAYCTYLLINSSALHANVTFTRLARVVDAEVRTCEAGGSWRSRVVGALSEGGECRLGTNDIYFFPASAPGVDEKIVVTYRTAARAIARVVDEAGVAALAGPNDSGHRSVIVSVESPRPRTSEDCECAASVLLEIAAQPRWRGEHRMRDPNSDFYPGDALQVRAAARAAEFKAIAREVEIEAADLLEDRSITTVKFSTEAAEAVALRTNAAPEVRLPEEYIVKGNPPWYPPDPREAEVIDIGSTNVMIDAGADPAEGGGFEVRRSDSGWGMENDRNLVGRFDYRIFTVPRTSRTQTWHIRQYDASSPVRYSRRAAVLHIDYPL